MRCISLLVLLCVGLAPAIAFAKPTEQERAKICAKAEKRYKKLFGKAPGDEPVTIVMMYKYTFCPDNLTVKKGQTVRWVNVDKRTSHSVWFKEQGKPESERLFGEEQVEMKIDIGPGTQRYLCGPHHKEEDMIGTLTVTE